ncbi:MAG: tRNA-guanine(34) transglycosylase, partial [bacterium]|nr:tRNA-guanine(34) transglycosylase [bacterium]
SALLAAGFYVGEGVGTGPKASTTVAMSSIGEGTSGIELLGSDWLQRFGRSTSKWSEDASPEEKVKIEELVQAHPQFVEKV